MLHVILQILAIIGIVLLCILGFIILLLLLVLFVPIRYRAEGSKYGEDIRLKVRVSYLLRLLTVRFEYPEPGSVIARVFGIKVFDTAKKAKESGDGKKEKKGKAKNADEAAEAENAGTEAVKAETSGSEVTTAETIKTEAAGATEAGATETGAAEAGATETGAAEAEVAEAGATEAEAAGAEPSDSGEAEAGAAKDAAEEEKLSFRDKIKKIIYTIRNFCDKIKHIKDTIREIAENISYYKEVITHPDNKELYGRVKDRIFKVLKSIRPRVLKAALHIGTGSPDTTGYLCAVYGMLLPILGNHVILDADFEEAVWEGDFFLKGRITIFTLLRHAVGLLLDKQLRIFMKQMKREE